MTQTPTTEVRCPAVCLQGVVKAYQCGNEAQRVLDGVDLNVDRGEVVFLAGPSGSGKTTLLSILGCILSADQGRMEILGTDISRLSGSERAAMRLERIGFVFQRFHLIRGLTASENVGVPLVLRGVEPRRARERSETLLEAVGLADKRKSCADKLSSGQCQRVALARALANDPDLILADEPTASLDAANGHAMMELLWRLTVQEDRTAIVVTHDHRIFSFADRVYWLDNGRIAEQTDAAETPSRGAGGIAVHLPPWPGGLSSLIPTQG
jgi:putative ABC transport system ATP-binding protein